MADITITAANVIAGSGASILRGAAGGAVTAGQIVARNSNGTFVPADNNAVTASGRTAIGVALNGAANGQPIAVASAGPVTIGGTLTAGVAYYLSDTPGGICPVADVGAGEYVVLLGIATSTSVLNVAIQNSGVSL